MLHVMTRPSSCEQFPPSTFVFQLYRHQNWGIFNNIGSSLEVTATLFSQTVSLFRLNRFQTRVQFTRKQHTARHQSPTRIYRAGGRMKLLTHNMLACHIKGHTENMSFRIEVCPPSFRSTLLSFPPSSSQFVLA